MTRETKIGLLVGLAFIIVIGILLSDHMTSTTQPPTAALADTAPNVRESVTSPAPTNPAPAPVGVVQPITPANPVLTQSEIRPPVVVAPPVQVAHQPVPSAIPAPVSQVVIGGPAVQQPAPIAIRQSGAPVQQQVAVAPQPEEATSAQDQWEQLQPEAPVVPTQVAAPVVQAPAVPVTPVQPAGPKREYVAVAGDSLSRIAAKMFGADSKANREAIVRANPTLQKNPDLVVEGRKYTIPAAPAVAAPTAAASTVAAAPKPAAVAQAIPASAQIPDTVPVAPRNAPAAKPAKVKAIPVTELVDALPMSSPATGGGYWYVVKDNDNLWKIAAEQLGSGNAWTQIKELNKDVLKGGDNVQPNMRLRLPAKPLASAS